MSSRPFIAVYIMANKRNGTLYTGVTNNLPRRVWEHQQGTGSHFTATWGLKMLVWYQVFETMDPAIAREKVLKKWRRAWKLTLIEKTNFEWRDLTPELRDFRPLKDDDAPFEA
jgi:putative endonuclease